MCIDVILGNCTKLLLVDLPGIKAFRLGQRLHGIYTVTHCHLYNTMFDGVLYCLCFYTSCFTLRLRFLTAGWVQQDEFFIRGVLNMFFFCLFLRQITIWYKRSEAFVVVFLKKCELVWPPKVCVCVCFLPIHSGHEVRWTYQPGSHRRKVTQDF